MSVSFDNDSDSNLILKGVTYDISPLNIILAIHVIIHNTIIIVDYYKDRARLTSTLFMGIAISDILTAQGLLIISVISILVYRGPLDENVLYNSFYYYMITGLPGFSSSRFLNLVMSITLTVHIVDPFRRFHTTVLRRSCQAIILVLTCLHISDAISAVILDYKYHVTGGFKYQYVLEVAMFEFPGVITTVMMKCNLEKELMDIRSCVDKREYLNSFLYPVVISFGILYQLVLVLTIPICMIVQVVYLRRGSVLVSDDKRHASNTIMINSFLYFICQVTYFIMVFLQSEWLYKMSIKPEIVGLFLGLTEFTLPLLYAAVFPIVLICRKEELRRRYQDRLSRIIFCCREESQVPDEVRNDVPEDVNHDVTDEAADNID